MLPNTFRFKFIHPSKPHNHLDRATIRHNYNCYPVGDISGLYFVSSTLRTIGFDFQWALLMSP